jgi:hypothetical protein
LIFHNHHPLVFTRLTDRFTCACGWRTFRAP